VNKLPRHDAHGAIIGTFGLNRDITGAKELGAALDQTHSKLVDASRRAGLAEIATSMLHNVGNVLNSLDVSASLIATGLRHFKAGVLVRLGSILREHAADHGTFLTTDPKGRRVPEYVETMAFHFTAERDRLLQEIESLQKNVEHIKDIVAMQQNYADMGGLIESLDPATLMEDSLRMNDGSLVRHKVQVVRDFQVVPSISAEKGKVLQILVNLIRNGIQVCDAGGVADKVLTLRITPGAPGRVQLLVQDKRHRHPHRESHQDFQPWLHDSRHRAWVWGPRQLLRRERNERRADRPQ
jgi:signal transduction histidine kinase